MEFNEYKDTIQHQEDYTKSLYYDADKLSLIERKEVTKNQVIGLQGELDEFVQATKLLPWKSGQENLNVDNIKEELIDIYHFFMNLCNLWGIRDEDTLRQIYFKKNAINKERGKIHQKPTEGFKAG